MQSEISDTEIEFKSCSCSIESWEKIVVQGDENFDDKNTIYFHCCRCSEDFAVVDFETEEILYLNPKVKRS